MMTTLELLVAAKELISDENVWMKGCNARNASGLHSAPDSQDAVRWCAQGALLKYCPVSSDSSDYRILAKTKELLCRAVADDLTHFNDNHTHAEVFGMFDKAIELAKKD